VSGRTEYARAGRDPVAHQFASSISALVMYAISTQSVDGGRGWFGHLFLVAAVIMSGVPCHAFSVTRLPSAETISARVITRRCRQHRLIACICPGACVVQNPDSLHQEAIVPPGERDLNIALQ